MLDTNIPPSLLEALGAVLGPRGLLTKDIGHYGEDWRQLYNQPPLAVLRPATVAELAEAVLLCVANRVAIVPQGGNTSMVGGGVPGGPGQIVVSLARMNRVRAIDPWT